MIKKIFAAMILTLILTFAPNVFAYPHITYQAHVADYGWLDPVGNNEVAGTTGQSLRMEALRINFDGGIRYCAHVADYGWLDWVKNGEIAGTTGQSLRMEAVQIRLVEKDSRHDYDDDHYRKHRRYDDDEYYY